MTFLDKFYKESIIVRKAFFLKPVEPVSVVDDNGKQTKIMPEPQDVIDDVRIHTKSVRMMC